jgi:hypothetical protein
MRGPDEHAATNQRHTDPLERARIRAVLECEGRLVPDAIHLDVELDELAPRQARDGWDYLDVGYLRGEWPTSRLC